MVGYLSSFSVRQMALSNLEGKLVVVVASKVETLLAKLVGQRIEVEAESNIAAVASQALPFSASAGEG